MYSYTRDIVLVLVIAVASATLCAEQYDIANDPRRCDVSYNEIVNVADSISLSQSYYEKILYRCWLNVNKVGKGGALSGEYDSFEAYLKNHRRTQDYERVAKCGKSPLLQVRYKQLGSRPSDCIVNVLMKHIDGCQTYYTLSFYYIGCLVTGLEMHEVMWTSFDH